MQRVLVTGAAGFVGRHCLAPLLARGYEVHALSSSGREVPADGVVWHTADLLDADGTDRIVHTLRPSHLLHLAWHTTPASYRTSPANLAWVEASLRLVRGFYEHGGSRAVLVGSCYEYDWDHDTCQEQVTPLNPTTLYGVCKAALFSIFDRYVRQNALSGAWGRLFFLYGPHAPMEKMPGLVISAVESGQSVRCSHGEQVRDFMFVADAADALVGLLDSGVQGPVNIATGQGTQLKELILNVADYCGGRELVELGAVPTSPGEPPVLVADTQRLNQEVQWAAARDLSSGVRETVEWWRRHARQLAKS
jgi:nucleoside-diphosphate-sugar epimerase